MQQHIQVATTPIQTAHFQWEIAVGTAMQAQPTISLRPAQPRHTSLTFKLP